MSNNARSIFLLGVVLLLLFTSNDPNTETAPPTLEQRSIVRGILQNATESLRNRTFISLNESLPHWSLPMQPQYARFYRNLSGVYRGIVRKDLPHFGGTNVSSIQGVYQGSPVSQERNQTQNDERFLWAAMDQFRVHLHAAKSTDTVHLLQVRRVITTFLVSTFRGNGVGNRVRDRQSQWKHLVSI